MTPVVSTTSIILSFNVIHNGDILVLANPASRGKMAVKTERDTVLGNFSGDDCKLDQVPAADPRGGGRGGDRPPRDKLWIRPCQVPYRSCTEER